MRIWLRSSVVERCLHKAMVAGSNPAAATMKIPEETGIWDPREKTFTPFPLSPEVEAEKRRVLEEQAAEIGLPIEEFAKAAGLTPAQVTAMDLDTRLVSYRVGKGNENRKLYASWQARDGQLLPGIDQVIQAYPGALMSLAVYGTEPQADLGGLTPAQALGQGKVQDVLSGIGALPQDAKTGTSTQNPGR